MSTKMSIFIVLLSFQWVVRFVRNPDLSEYTCVMNDTIYGHLFTNCHYFVFRYSESSCCHDNMLWQSLVGRNTSPRPQSRRSKSSREIYHPAIKDLSEQAGLTTQNIGILIKKININSFRNIFRLCRNDYKRCIFI